MVRTQKEDAIRLLIERIELSIGRRIQTPRDFLFLRECIFARLRLYLSESTLKRVWGYVTGGETRLSTLNCLASFLGYSGFDEFVKMIDTDNSRIISSYLLGRHISVSEHLEPGDRIRLVWQPDRVCVIQYLGEHTFEVVESIQTRLRPGDTFTCSFIIEGEPLYIDNLRQSNRPPVNYVCGKISGIRFERLSDND